MREMKENTTENMRSRAHRPSPSVGSAMIQPVGTTQRTDRAAGKSLLVWLTVFAVGMAYFEAALVVYVRELLYPQDILQIFPMRLMTPSLLVIERGRETATLVMLVSVALITQTTFIRRLAAFVYLFGLWDIFYYVWLKATIGWPMSWLEWDVLFLIPWVWLGPWVCPALIAALHSAWGARALVSPSTPRFGKVRAGAVLVGALLCLMSFLQPGLSGMLEAGIDGLEGYVPDGFWWPLYVAGWILMAMGLPWVQRRE